MNPNALAQARKRAAAFSLEWAKEADEKGEAHSFWDAFFKIFDLERRHFARHESRVTRAGKGKGFMDLFWRGKLLVEHKSAHKNKPVDWADTLAQALDYIEHLEVKDRPQVVVLCNFQRFQIFDLNNKDYATDFIDLKITELEQKIHLFDFLPRFAEKIFEEEETANLRAINNMANIHEAFVRARYTGNDLERLLVRILFCLFAEDTGIFEPKQFSKFIEEDTLDNGSDIGEALVELFEVLNTPVRERPAKFTGKIRQFPYVNGGLFAEPLSATPPSLIGIRGVILNCAPFDWSEISPEIFGSLFQAVLTSAERRSLGAHFTSEKNIRRLIEPLFLRDLWAEFADIRFDKKKLTAFRKKLGSLRFLDPACGCGNFLVVTYRELRLLDIQVMQQIQDGQYIAFDISTLENVQLDHFYGLEIKPVSALIAQVALWLTKHQCNRILNSTFDTHIKTVPLDETPNILAGNALQTDWGALLPTGDLFDFIIGNPPFIGSKIMDDVQRTEIKDLFGNESGSGTLDYVTGWYLKAAQYMDISPKTVTAFVSTNSISQGEQVGMLWGHLFEKHGVSIRFAHQTFKWMNEAPGVAAVFCIIIGYGKSKLKECRLFEYADIKGEPEESVVKNINPYLVEAGNVVIRSRSKPICNVPEIGIGNKPIDGGFYLFETEEKEVFIKEEPRAEPFFRRWIGSDEFINGWERWCLWLGETDTETLKSIPLIWNRVESVRKTRLASKSAPTQKLAEKPTRFHVENMPKSNYLVIPEVSSERRVYIPIGYENPETLASNKTRIIANASLFHFGVLTSEMHMSWTRRVCGRLKSDYNYSKDIVYNNFPFPNDVDDTEKAAVESAAQTILDIRLKHAPKSLAELYDPNKMPADLLAAHKALDKAVDASYGLKRGFGSEAKRVAWLFEQYEILINKQPKTKK